MLMEGSPSAIHFAISLKRRMEMEDRESAGSDSGLRSDDYAEQDGGGSGGGDGGEAVVETMNPGASMENNAAVAISLGIGEGSGATGGEDISAAEASAAVMSGETAGGRGGAKGCDSAVWKKKRGRPRKYDSNGDLNPAYMKSSQAMHSGFYVPALPAKRGRGRPSASANCGILSSFGELFASTTAGDFTPHIVTVKAGEDVAGKILTFAQKRHRGICILSANGSVSSVTLRQPTASGGLLTYEGRFEILTLRGSYAITGNDGTKSLGGGLSVSLASPDGQVIGGGVAGSLTAASPVQIVIGSFVPNDLKPPKRTQYSERQKAHPIQYPPATAPDTTPMSQAAPATSIYRIPPAPFPQAGGENASSSKDLPNSGASNGAANWSCSDRRPSPDINISVPVEDH